MYNDKVFQLTGNMISERVFAGIKESRQWLLVTFSCAFLGIFGIHRFAVKRYLSGVVYIGTAGFLGVGVILDLIKLFRHRFHNRDYEVVSSTFSVLTRVILFLLLILAYEFLSTHLVNPDSPINLVAIREFLSMRIWK
jgi:TM2 domain-containing membrane protein YozV